MTPEAAFAFIREFGLPISILAVFGWLILRRKLVTGAELETMVALFERERQDRIAAEAIVAKFAAANADVAEAVADLSRTVLVKRAPVRRNAYTERERG